MARKLLVGWDSDASTPYSNPGALGGGDGTPTQTAAGTVLGEATIIRPGSGAGSLKVFPGSGAQGYYQPTGVAYTAAPLYVRFYLRVTVLPATTRFLLSSPNAIVTGTIGLKLKTDGALEVWTVPSSSWVLQGTSTAKLTDTTRWYRIELKAVNGASELRIDGNTEVTTNATVNFLAMAFGAGDTVAATYTAYFDDAVWDDSDWPGASHLNLLLPTSDAQVGSWTGGAGGTTNLFEAVNNNPPIGTASETDLTQIESVDNSGNNSTDEYIANLTTYAAAGITGTVKAVQAYAWTGEDVSTGAKAGSIACASNPSDASVGFTFGPLAGGALGTWNTNWAVATSIATTNPSVTLTSSPQVALRKTDTGTRVASCCFIGMYVEYEPSPSLPPLPLARRRSFRALLTR